MIEVHMFREVRTHRMDLSLRSSLWHWMRTNHRNQPRHGVHETLPVQDELAQHILNARAGSNLLTARFSSVPASSTGLIAFSVENVV